MVTLCTRTHASLTTIRAHASLTTIRAHAHTIVANTQEHELSQSSVITCTLVHAHALPRACALNVPEAYIYYYCRGSGLKKIDFSRQIFENFDFFQALSHKNFDFFHAKIGHLQLLLSKLFYFSSKATTFEHTSCI